MFLADFCNFDTVIFACSGPSLNKITDIFSLGLPVISISTTIRTIPNPHVWIYSDYLNEMHGEQGKQAYVNPNIIKIIQEGKETNHISGNNIHTYPCQGSNRTFDANKHLFNFSQPFARGPHKSITFGIQWAHSIGIKNIIFAGNDLNAESMENKYCYKTESYDIKKKHNFKRTLSEVETTLIDWFPIAQKHGYNWYSWECGSVFDKIVPEFNYEIYEKIMKTNAFLKKPDTMTHEIIELETENKSEYQESCEKYLALMRKIKNL